MLSRVLVDLENLLYDSRRLLRDILPYARMAFGRISNRLRGIVNGARIIKDVVLKFSGL